MSSILPTVAHEIHGFIDPAYKERLAAGRFAAISVEIFALASVVADVAYAIFGIGLLCSGAIPAGSRMLLNSILGSYFYFNLYQVSKNAENVFSNPKKYITLCGFGDEVDNHKLKTELFKNTIGLNWLANPV